MGAGRSNDMYKQYCEQVEENEKLKKEIKRLTNIIKILEAQLKEAGIEKAALKKTVEKLKAEVARLKVSLKKDSTNSSKPSSTDGYKEVPNNREKSNKKQGGQKGHKGSTMGRELLKKVEEHENTIIKDPIEINKNPSNANKKPIIHKEIDIEITYVITTYEYYPNEDGSYDIPKEHRKEISYGNNLKTLAMELMYDSYNSTDATKRIISSITDNMINVSKGTLMNWAKELSNALEPELQHIEEELMNSYYAHFDESNIKVNGKNSNEICACNDIYVRMWTRKHKTHEELDKIDFFHNYMGAIVKDGTDIYNGFGTKFAQCIIHIERYLKGIYENVEHKGPKKMRKFLIKWSKKRDRLIAKGVKEFSEEKQKEIMDEFSEIFREWKKEWMGSDKETNPVYDDERRLLARFEDEDEREQILQFIHDFKIPSNNNPVELQQRNIKQKQKIGKFRSEGGSEIYVNIRSCINTYINQDINVYKAIKSAFDKKVVIA